MLYHPHSKTRYNSDMDINQTIFKAYDIRGVYPNELNEKTARTIGRTLRKFVFKSNSVVVGRDVRNSSPTLYSAVLEGLGAPIQEIGIVTTPMFYFLVKELGASGGIMVTASHNPAEYNGFKVVNERVEMIGGEEILKFIHS